MNKQPTMQKKSPKPLRSLWLASAGLAPALALIVLGASTPRLAAQQSDNFDNQSIANWSRYTYAVTNTYGVATYSFPTNPASADNYAVRIQVPPIVKDSNSPPALLSRGGIIWTNGDAMYGPTDPNNPGFAASVDLIAWSTEWSDSVCGLGWFVQGASFMATSAYFSGWGPGLSTIGITSLDLGKDPPYQVLGQVADGTTVLKTNHQYRISASSYDGATFLVSVFDRSQTNAAWQSAISQDYALYTSGYCALMVANTGIPAPWATPGNSTQGGDATFDNYSVYRPISGQEPAASPARQSDAYPPPAGQAAQYYPTVSASILDLETHYRPGTVQLYLDGTLITSGANITNTVVKPDPAGGTINWPGVTITYSNGVFYSPGSWHTNTVVFQTDQEISSNPGHFYTYSNTWSWQAFAPMSLYASNSLPIGSLGVRGFKGRTVVSTVGINNSMADAFKVLDYPATNAAQVALSATNITQLVAWDIGNSGWHWGAVTNYPGLCYPTIYPNNVVCQVQAYLQLTNGVHRFHVDSDDGVAIYSGTSVDDTSALLLMAGNNGGSVTHADFDFYVPATGLYPFNIIHEEGGGDAYLCLYEVDVNPNMTSGPSNLLNSSSSKVAAYYPAPTWQATASSTVKTGYNPVVSTLTAGNNTGVTTVGTNGDNTNTCAIINQTVTGLSGTNTITVTPGSSPMFYRLSGPGSSQIMNCTKSGANLAITYRWQAP
jgi:hypothetical protein